MAHPTLASAVVLPHASPSPPPQAGTKRRQSDVSNASPKRQRLSPSPSHPEDSVRAKERSHATSPESRPGNTTHSDRTRQATGAPRIDEKRRSQRLFGALLGGLGPQRPANSAASKRRAEQDERRREETRKREAEIGERQKHRLDRLNTVRRKEQRKVDEVNMRVRHSNMIASVHFLVTETEPKLYYKPWELRPEDEDRMKRRREDIESQIDRELDDFAETRRKWREEDGDTQLEPEQSAEKPLDDMRKSGDDGVTSAVAQRSEAMDTDTTKDNTLVLMPDEPRGGVALVTNDPIDQLESERQRKESIDDDAGDVVVEAEEDTVIY